MSKTLINAATTALDLCRDSYGNGISGQEERGLRYLALAVEQLEALIGALEDRSDMRRMNALERLTRSLREDTHPAYEAFPPMNSKRISQALAVWHDVGLPNVLKGLSDEEIPSELMEAIEAGKPGDVLTVKVPAAAVKAVFGSGSSS